MKRTKHFLTVVLVMLVLGASLAAQPFMGKRMGQGHMMTHKKSSPAKILMLLKEKQKEFNITDNQLDQIKDKVFALEENMISLTSKISLHRLELKKLMMNEKKDYGKISALFSKISGNRQAIFIERLKTRDAIDGILTPEQRDAIKAARKNRFQRPGFPGKGRMGRMQRGFFPGGDDQDFNFEEN